MDEVLASRTTIGPMINSKLEPIIVRAQTRKNRPLNRNQNKRNINTVKGLSRLLDKAKNKNPTFQQKRDWLSRLSRVMNEQYTFNNLEQAFLGPALKIESATRLAAEVERTRKYKMPAPTNGKFPTLYSKSKTGKTQVWQIQVIKYGGDGPAAAERV